MCEKNVIAFNLKRKRVKHFVIFFLLLEKKHIFSRVCIIRTMCTSSVIAHCSLLSVGYKSLHNSIIETKCIAIVRCGYLMAINFHCYSSCFDKFVFDKLCAIHSFCHGNSKRWSADEKQMQFESSTHTRESYENKKLVWIEKMAK